MRDDDLDDVAVLQQAQNQQDEEELSLSPVEKELKVWEALTVLKSQIGQAGIGMRALEEYVDEVVNTQKSQSEKLDELLAKLSENTQTQQPLERNKMSDQKEEIEESMGSTTKMVLAGVAGVVVGAAVGGIVIHQRNKSKEVELRTQISNLQAQLPAPRS